MSFLVLGIHNILITNPRDLKTVTDAFTKYNPGYFLGINTLFNALNNNETFRSLDFTDLQSSFAGGMAV